MISKDQIEQWKIAADTGSIPDEHNPLFLFSLTHHALLAKIVRGELDALELAKLQLRERGLDENGNWVGFGG